MKKLIFLFLFAPAYVYGYADHLVISQVQISGGTGLTTNDFIEIYNPTSQDIDLEGMRLVKRTKEGASDVLIKSWTNPTVVTARGYYLWANSDYTAINMVADVTTSATIANDNGIALRQGANDSGMIIDSVAWGESANLFAEGLAFASNPGPNEALLRTADTDNNALDFSITSSNPRNSSATEDIAESEEDVEPEPEVIVSPAPAPLPIPSGGGSVSQSYSNLVIISEFMVNPDGADSGEEWVELFSPVEVDLGGWILDDESINNSIGSSAYTIPLGTKILANQYLVINLPSGSFALDNTGGDTLRLIWPNKLLSHSVTYKTSPKIDESYALMQSGSFAWTNAVTPGLPNQEAITTEFEQPEDSTAVETEEENLPEIIITELLPKPSIKSNLVEFIELLNVGEQAADLSGFKLTDNAGKYTLKSSIGPGEFLVIYKTESKIALNNTGSELVTLISPKGVEIDSMAFENAITNHSYNLRADGSFAWSSTPTHGKTNRITVDSSEKIPNIVLASKIEQEEAEILEPIYTEEPAAEIVAPIAFSNEQIAGAGIESNSGATQRQVLWPWLLGSFALNSVFCYILIKLMIRKGSIKD